LPRVTHRTVGNLCREIVAIVRTKLAQGGTREVLAEMVGQKDLVIRFHEKNRGKGAFLLAAVTL
jgi:hypothetical protein